MWKWWIFHRGFIKNLCRFMLLFTLSNRAHRRIIIWRFSIAISLHFDRIVESLSLCALSAVCVLCVFFCCCILSASFLRRFSSLAFVVTLVGWFAFSVCTYSSTVRTHLTYAKNARYVVPIHICKNVAHRCDYACVAYTPISIEFGYIDNNTCNCLPLLTSNLSSSVGFAKWTSNDR